MLMIKAQHRSLKLKPQDGEISVKVCHVGVKDDLDGDVEHDGGVERHPVPVLVRSDPVDKERNHCTGDNRSPCILCSSSPGCQNILNV